MDSLHPTEELGGLRRARLQHAPREMGSEDERFRGRFPCRPREGRDAEVSLTETLATIPWGLARTLGGVSTIATLPST